MFGSLALLLLSGSLQAADCDKTWPTASLEQSLSAVEQAFVDFDKLAVSKGYTMAGSQLRCLSEPLSPDAAAQFHRVTGLVRFLEHQDESTRSAFAAARAIDPEFTLPESIAPDGHPLHDYYGAIDLAALPEERLPAAATGQLLRDGRPAKMAHRALPAIYQLVDDQQAPTWTVLVLPGDPLPAYEQAAPPAPEPVADATQAGGEDLGLAVQPPPERQGGGVNVPLLAGAGGAAVVSAVTYGLAWKAKADWDTAANQVELDGAYDRNHTMCIVSGATLVATAGLGVSAVLVARF
jgi:hypothetical protein